MFRFSKKHYVRSAEAIFSHGKSVTASCELVTGTLFLPVAITDPRSGEIEPAALAWITVGGLPAAILAVFYLEFHARNKQKVIISGPTKQRSRVKQRRIRESSGRSRC